MVLGQVPGLARPRDMASRSTPGATKWRARVTAAAEAASGAARRIAALSFVGMPGIAAPLLHHVVRFHEARYVVEILLRELAAVLGRLALDAGEGLGAELVPLGALGGLGQRGIQRRKRLGGHLRCS